MPLFSKKNIEGKTRDAFSDEMGKSAKQAQFSQAPSCESFWEKHFVKQSFSQSCC